MPIQEGLRFPDAESVIPYAGDMKTRLQVSEEDCRFLRDTLPRVVTDEENTLTVELNGAVVVRSKGSEQTPGAELVLSGSRRAGEELSINSGRANLLRAAQFGFDEIELRDKETPLLIRNDRYTYLWMPFSGDPVPASERLQRIVSSGAEPTEEPASPTPNRKRHDMKSNGKTNGSTPTATTASSETDSVDQLVARATDIKTKLRDLQTDMQELITALRGQKKQARLVRSTIDSLQKLQTLQA